jgi:peptidoglycan/LPS O-acetylase OafA/YrhL
MVGSDKFRPDIQGLRAVAVMVVVLFHAEIARFSGGFVGVDVFFVISGFLITRLLRDKIRDGSFTFSGFYARRIRRLFPALLATVVLTFIAGAFILSPPLFAGLAKSSVAAIFSVSNIYFWMDSGYFDAANILKPLLHTWSLGVEEQFYLVWPLVMFAAMRVSERMAILVLAFSAALSVAAGYWFIDHPTALFYWMPFRIFELAIGGLMVWAIESSKPPVIVRESATIIGLAMILFAVFVFDGKTPFPINGLVPTIGAALIIYASGSVASALLGNRPAVWIGTISYSIYLAHWPVVVLYRYAVDRGNFNDTRTAIVIVAAIVLGAALYYTVENPLRRRGKIRLHLATAIPALLVAITAFGSGWVWRLGDRALAYNGSVTGEGAAYGGASCSPPRCSNGVKNGRPLYVIGDSHGRAYYAGLVQHFPNRPIIVFEASGCSFFSTRYSKAELVGTEYKQPCDVARKIAFDELRKSGDFDLIIAHSWYVYPVVSDNGEIIKFSSVKDFGQFVGKEIDHLRDELHPHSLTVIGDVPTSGFYGRRIKDCIGRIQSSAEMCRSTPASNYLIHVRKQLNDALREGIRATFLDPYSALCDDSNCYMMKDGQSLYSDWDHLSVAGSKYVVSRLFTE